MKNEINNSLDDKIHVAFCIDKNYPVQLMLVINSILINNTSKSKYKFYILEDNLSKFDKLHIKLFVKAKGQEVEIIHVDTTVIDGGKNLYKNFLPLSITTYITRIGTARILLPKLLTQLKKILYLDVDTIVLSDLKSLWEYDLDDYAAGMSCHIRDNSEENKNYILRLEEYFNIGVMIINSDKWRKENLSDEIIKLLKQNKYPIPDQDAINEALKGKIKEIPYIYNATYFSGLDTSSQCISKLKILHYFYQPKPWDRLFWNKKVFADEFLKPYFKNWNSSYLKIFKLKYYWKSFKNFVQEKNFG